MNHLHQLGLVPTLTTVYLLHKGGSRLGIRDSEFFYLFIVEI